MEANLIFIGFFVISVLLFRYWQGNAAHHRVWIGQVEGRSIQLNVEQATCTLLVDGEEVLTSDIHRSFRPVSTTGGVRFRQCFRFDIDQKCDLLAGQQVQIQSDWTHSQKGDVSVYIEGKRIPLIEVSDKREHSIQAVQSSLVSTKSIIQDARWEGIQKTLTTIRQHIQEEERKNITVLYNMLYSRFSLLDELKSEDSAAVWSNIEERDTMLSLLEKEIEQTLMIVQRLHQLSIQKRKERISENELQDVFQLIQRLDAEQEVEAPSNISKKKLMQRLAKQKNL